MRAGALTKHCECSVCGRGGIDRIRRDLCDEQGSSCAALQDACMRVGQGWLPSALCPPKRLRAAATVKELARGDLRKMVGLVVIFPVKQASG